MTTLNLSITEAQGKAIDLNVENLSEHNTASVINGVFSLFGAQAVIAIGDDKSVEPLSVVQDSPKEEVVELPTVVSGFQVQSVELPKVAIEPTTMEEALAATEKPEFFSTGVKLTEDGKKKYKCRYRCTKCANKGNHYIPQHIDAVECHECATTLQVKNAVIGEPMKRDSYGNFYVAGNQWPQVSIPQR